MLLLLIEDTQNQSKFVFQAKRGNQATFSFKIVYSSQILCTPWNAQYHWW